MESLWTRRWPFLVGAAAHVAAVRLGDPGTVVIMLPVPNWTIGAGWPGYRGPGPAGLLD